MGIFDFILGKKRKEQERLRLEEEARQKKLKQERQEREEENNNSFDNDMTRQLWEQFGKATNRTVIFTSHLLFLQQLVSDSFFAYKHASDTSKIPTFMWAEKKLYLGDTSKIAYTVPFLWIRNMAKNDVQKFNEAMDLLNTEYQIDTKDSVINDILEGIRSNGFYRFHPDFDSNVNKEQLSILYKDSACLLKLINFFGDNVNMIDLLPTQDNSASIPSASITINNMINEMIRAFRSGKINH